LQPRINRNRQNNGNIRFSPRLHDNNKEGVILTPQTVESWLREGATEGEKKAFKEMYKSIFEYKSVQTPRQKQMVNALIKISN